MPNTFIFKLLVAFLISLCLCLVLAGQDPSASAVTGLLRKSEECHKRFAEKESLEYAKAAYDLARSDNIADADLLAESAYRVATSAASLGLPEQALTFAEEAQKHCSADNIALRVKINDVFSFSYLYLGLSEEALSIMQRSVALLEDQDKPSDRRDLALLYQNIGTYYYHENQLDSARNYFRASKALLFALPEKEYYREMAEFYYNEAQECLDNHLLDSAYYWIQKSIVLRDRYQDSIRHMEYVTLGGYYAGKGDKESALRNFLLAESNMMRHGTVDPKISYIYYNIGQLYADIGNHERAALYMKRYAEQKEDLAQKQKQDVQFAVKILTESKLEEKDLSHFRKVVGISLLALLVVAALLYMYARIRRKKDLVAKELDSEKATVDQLQKKVNDAFEEVKLLAESNDPQFWARFQEVYPDFRYALSKINDKLTVSELTLAAYLYLGYQTKIIANITCRSLKTVENIRFSLRKKFNLSPKESLTLFIQTSVGGEM